VAIISVKSVGWADLSAWISWAFSPRQGGGGSENDGSLVIPQPGEANTPRKKTVSAGGGVGLPGEEQAPWALRVDLGFHLDKNATVEQMRNSALAKSLDILQNKLKFKSVSFRLLKEVHTETEEEIEEGKIIPAHFIFPMYVDVLVDNIPAKFKDVFRFQPADEPLL
jgi:hypothetical protein